MELELNDTEVRCPNCMEIKSKLTDRFAVVILANTEGQEKPEVWCQDCANKAKAEPRQSRVN